MPQTKVPFSELSGAVIEVEISYPGKYAGQAPSSEWPPIVLLVDTGSRRTFIPASVAQLLGLPLRGSLNISNLATMQIHDVWSADLFIPSLGKHFSRRMVVDFPQPQVGMYDGIIGRDILSLGFLRLDGPAMELEIIF
jgi:hypothetical protein